MNFDLVKNINREYFLSLVLLICHQTATDRDIPIQLTQRAKLEPFFKVGTYSIIRGVVIAFQVQDEMSMPVPEKE